MAEGARVRSVAELAGFHAFLAQLGEAVRHGVGEADAEVRRVERWLTEDRPAELVAAARRAARVLEAAAEDLRRKRMQPTPTGAPPSTDVERRVFDRARAAVERVDQLARATGRWGRVFTAEAAEYVGQAQGAREAPDGRVPQARARLAVHLAALEAYMNTPRVPGTAGPPAARDGAEPDPGLEADHNTPGNGGER